MKTIDKILKSYGYSRNFINHLENQGIMNGCGAKNGFNFSNFLEKLKKYKTFKSEKYKKLIRDFRIVCNIHDLQFYHGGTFFDFICANLQLANNIVKLLHWTGFFKRIFVFITIFFGTTLFGYKNFNFKK